MQKYTITSSDPQNSSNLHQAVYPNLCLLCNLVMIDKVSQGQFN